MLVAACKARLVTALTHASGGNLPARSVVQSAAEARGLSMVPSAVILAGPEKMIPDGSLVGIREADGVRYRRRRAWQHILQIGVVLYHRTEADAGLVVAQSVAQLGAGFQDAENNWNRLIRVIPSWLDLRDVGERTGESRASLLAEKTGVAIGFEFLGGLYTEEVCPKVPDFTTTIETEVIA